MQEKREPEKKFEQLRRQAEMLIKDRPDDDCPPPTDMLQLIHELRVFQTELEIQNEELKQSQQGLVDLLCEFEDLYEFAPCGYMTINSRGTIRRINLRGVALLGAERERLYLKSLSSLISPDWKEAYWAALKVSGESGEKQSLELRLQREEGAPIWVRADILADRDEDGGVKQWRLALIDITEEKEAREALRKSEQRFRELFQNGGAHAK